jgi:hypothetical protein
VGVVGVGVVLESDRRSRVVYGVDWWWVWYGLCGEDVLCRSEEDVWNVEGQHEVSFFFMRWRGGGCPCNSIEPYVWVRPRRHAAGRIMHLNMVCAWVENTQRLQVPWIFPKLRFVTVRGVCLGGVQYVRAGGGLCALDASLTYSLPCGYAAAS